MNSPIRIAAVVAAASVLAACGNPVPVLQIQASVVAVCPPGVAACASVKTPDWTLTQYADARAQRRAHGCGEEAPELAWVDLQVSLPQDGDVAAIVSPVGGVGIFEQGFGDWVAEIAVAPMEKSADFDGLFAVDTEGNVRPMGGNLALGRSPVQLTVADGVVTAAYPSGPNGRIVVETHRIAKTTETLPQPVCVRMNFFGGW